MARPKKTDAKTVGNVTVTTSANGVQKVKVAAGKTVKTATGKVAKGGAIVDNIASPKLIKATKAKNKEIFDEFEEDDFEEGSFENDYDDTSIPSESDVTDVVETRLYVTRDGIVGDVDGDGLLIVDTTGIDEEGLYELSMADADEIYSLAESLREPRAISSKHYFNNTGDYGHVRDLKILASGDLTRSELASIHNASDPFDEADNYDTSSFTVLSASRNVARNGHSGSFDDFNNDELIAQGVSY